ncbi:hypothetical protein ACFV0H_28385 [Streptomyces erythrochromogenes]|uniref:hypothetical protein n=1 Tax=Streptomyces erythrochromogenes TaxID=285574 RepID=UPI00367795E3
MSDTQAHCPFPGSLVRHTMYRGRLIRVVLCGHHTGVFADWDALPLRNYRRTHGLLPDEPIIGDRVFPKPEITCFQDSAKNAMTTAERAMWVSMQVAAGALAGFRYWSGVAAAYPTERHAFKFREKRTAWEVAKDHAEAMYATYVREDHEDHADLRVPDYFWHSVTCKAAEILRSRKR